MDAHEAAIGDRVIRAFTSLAVELIAEGSNPPPGAPEFLYHYTNASGLIGIVKHGELWASKANCLNDPQEVTYGRNLARQVIDQKYASAQTDRQFDPLVKRFYELLHQGLQPDGAWDADPYQRDPYIACFSADDDLIGQWAYYARDGGYNVGFRRSELVSGLPLGFELVRVVYDEDAQKRVYDSAIQRFGEEINKQLASESPRHQKAGVNTAARVMPTILNHLSARMKSPGFDPEDEWRLLFHHKNEATAFWTPAPPAGTKMKFRTQGSRIIPYFAAEYGVGKAPISSIMSGPTVEPAIARESIGALLSAYDYPYDRDQEKSRIRVLQSKITLRPAYGF